MSLVDYASSSDEDEEQIIKEEGPSIVPVPINLPNPPLSLNHGPGVSSSNQQAETSSTELEPAMFKLPDASLLLDSPDMSFHLMTSDHSSRVAAALAENASRKRESNGPVLTVPRTKVPKGRLPHSKNLPDTSGGLLRPPQLSGRSNVVTEDITKLFVKKSTDASSS